MNIDINKVATIGWGMVGKSTGYALGITRYIDKDSVLPPEQLKEIDIFIICLPTPTIEGIQDLSAIEEWLAVLKLLETNPIVVIRSTILPGTIDRFAEQYDGLKFAYVPEFLSEATALEDAKNPELLVIGARDILVKDVVSKLFSSPNMNIKHKILCSPTTAEVIKYTMNSFFALKVTYANQIWDVCKEIGANYEQISEALEFHKWGSKNGWNVWQGGSRGYGGNCLIKDTSAFVNKFELPLLNKMIEINEKLVKETK